MINTDLRIIFFASGPFAVRTYKELFLFGYNVVGAVTSVDKTHDQKGETIQSVSDEHGVDCLVVTNTKAESFKRWLTDRNPDIFCVISFKYLPADVVSIAKVGAFNVHASLLPHYRGAAPINWVIRNQEAITGLTAITLADRIDSGKVINVVAEKVRPDDTYGSLSGRLGTLCAKFTRDTIDCMSTDCWEERCTPQPDVEYATHDYPTAPKIDREYFTSLYETGFNISALARSVAPESGIPAVIVVTDKETLTTAKTMFVHICSVGESKGLEQVDYVDDKQIPHNTLEAVTKKKLLYTRNFFVIKSTIEILTLHVSGKKEPISAADFIKGFHYFRDKERYSVKLHMCCFPEDVEDSRSLKIELWMDDLRKLLESDVFVSDEKKPDIESDKEWLFECFRYRLSPQYAVDFHYYH